MQTDRQTNRTPWRQIPGFSRSSEHPAPLRTGKKQADDTTEVSRTRWRKASEHSSRAGRDMVDHSCPRVIEERSRECILYTINWKFERLSTQLLNNIVKDSDHSPTFPRPSSHELTFQNESHIPRGGAAKWLQKHFVSPAYLGVYQHILYF